MSRLQRAAADLTDDELRTLASHIARRCLEVERGLRPPDHLRALADPMIRARWRTKIRFGRFRGGPPAGDDVARPRVSRLAEDRAIATVVTRTEGPRWGAVTFELRAVGSTWHVTDLQRLLAASHYRDVPGRELDEPMSLEDRAGRAVEEQRLVRAALATTRRRLDELDGDAPGRDVIEHQHAYLQRALEGLDRELADLRSRQQLRRAVLGFRRA